LRSEPELWNERSVNAIAMSAPQQSITDRSIAWPRWEQVRRVLFLQDYNTRVVILGTTLLGCAAGMIGSFTLLRKRALMGDALSHATLPGIGLAFILAMAMGLSAKSLPILLVGATVTGLIGVGVILLLRNLTRLKEDAAMGAVLSVFFGAGVALLGVIQQMPEGHAAGLESFIYGKTASMGARDTGLIATAAFICIGACLLLFKEFKVLCFDEGFAGSRGFPVVMLDLALMGLVVIVCIVGLQAVGLILIIALLVIPAAAARFWTEKMSRMVLIAGVLGAGGGMVGAGLSGLFSKLPSGAMIVLVCAVIFAFSMFFGSARGVVIRLLRRVHLNRAVERQHLLRAMYEIQEAAIRARPGVARQENVPIPIHELLHMRSWSPKRLRRTIHRAAHSGLVSRINGKLHFSQEGQAEAARLTRQHRLWELYLINYADVAPGHVDREADAIEHVLEPKVVAALEASLQAEGKYIPQSPHPLGASSSGSAMNSSMEDR
jgi:manganese/zinc/iron transport system permease protein